MLQIRLREIGIEGGGGGGLEAWILASKWILPLPHQFSNLKIGNITKIKIEHRLNSKQIKMLTINHLCR